MASYKRKLPPPDPAAARSWIGKPIRDTQTNSVGLVCGIAEIGQDLFLKGRFPGQEEERLIAREPRPDREFLSPGEVKARYRPLTSEEIKRLKARRATGPSRA